MSISRDDLETSVWSDLQDDSPVIDILDGLLDRIHHGEPVDVDELLRQHPELADQLSGYIESLRFLNGAAADVAEFRGNSDPGILAEKRIATTNWCAKSVVAEWASSTKLSRHH